MTGHTVLDGDPFVVLYRRYEARFRLIARSRGLPHNDCQDLVQEAFTRGIAGFRDGSRQEPEKLAGWLYGILNNLIADYWRTKGRHERLLPSGDPEAIETAPFVPADQHVAEQVRRALQRMPRRHRIVLLLNVHQGLTIGEIAPILGRAPGTVGAILAEAKRQFRQHYNHAQEIDGLKRLKG